MTKITLDHVAVATRSPEKLKALWALLGLNHQGNEVVSEQAVKVDFFCGVPAVTRVEVLEPTIDTSPIGKYLSKVDGGIHHLCFSISGSLMNTMARVSQGGFQWIYSEPRLGAHGKYVNFLHPKSTGGIMIELSSNER